MFDGNKFLASESPLGRLYLYWEEFAGRRFLHIRYWYCDKADGVWKPGKKGIAVPEGKVQNTLIGLKAVLERDAVQDG